MFGRIFEQAMLSRGLDKRDMEILVRGKSEYLTDEQIFVFSRFITKYSNSNIFLTKYIGELSISVKVFNDIALVYEVKNKNNKVICTMDIDYYKQTLIVNYNGNRLTIMSNLFDYKENRTIPKDITMRFFNELMIRYYSQVMYAIYLYMQRR